MIGDTVGDIVGCTDGDLVGNTDVIVIGDTDGVIVGDTDRVTVGDTVGVIVGNMGEVIVGDMDEVAVGDVDEVIVGDMDEVTVGDMDKVTVGDVDEVITGAMNGDIVGDRDGVIVCSMKEISGIGVSVGEMLLIASLGFGLSLKLMLFEGVTETSGIWNGVGVISKDETEGKTLGVATEDVVGSSRSPWDGSGIESDIDELGVELSSTGGNGISEVKASGVIVIEVSSVIIGDAEINRGG